MAINPMAYSSLPRDEAIARLKSDSDELMSTFEDLSEDQWSSFNVAHVFTGSIPAFCYPAFQIMDYGVHSWDMRWGLGEKDARLNERTAGVLIPYMFIVWQGTVDPEAAKGVDITYGVKVDGEWGGQWKATVKDGQFNYEAVDDLSDAQAVFHFEHPSDMVLTTYQRIQGGDVTGDPAVAEKVRGLFFNI